MTGGGPDGKWPTRQQLCQVVEEKTVEDLKTLCPDGAVGLCRLLGSDPQKGLPDPMPDFDQRVEAFGGNWFAEKKLKAYWEYMWEAVQDKIILLLLAIGTIELIVKMAAKPEERSDGWIEPVAIYVTVLFIINVQSTMDYRRERLFDSLSAKVAASNMRFVVRAGKQVSLRDDQIVVGDIVTFNSHTAASVPADGILLFGEGVRIDESALTGEPEPIVKDHDHPFLLSGTAVLEGQGRMIVVAVGEHSVSGKIKKAVYEEDEGESPLFEKLDRMATAIGRVGTAVALVVFSVACIQGFAVHRSEASKIIEYLLLALGILAVAVPEGLPLALTIALAISSNKMSYQNNLVKTLDACETMGSVTTICTDKTGTLTANRMTVMAAYIGGKLLQMDRQKAVGQRLKDEAAVGGNVKELVATLIAVCSMDESTIEPPEEGTTEPKFRGNPTECAMLKFAEVSGYNYSTIREFTRGRNAMTKAQGCPKAFSSARKLMSWAVPREEGGYRVYVKGASEIVLARAVQAINATGQAHPVSEQERRRIEQEVIDPLANLALRTIGMAFKDVESKPDDATTNQVQNTDGSDAFVCETGLTLVGVMGIADPLRKEVPSAISQCYAAGIDVRMVTGDNLATAVAIAKEAGILNATLHFDAKGELKKHRAMEGKHFRKHVYTLDAEGNQVFHQDRFDEIWPYLRVLARSSPEDKLTLAKGLSGSSLFEDVDTVRRLQLTDGINIFPDRQVIAMTGDGTNDAPALKAADVGFAMGISGTQIAKDAANIILMDDNFASIVTAAKWGRNVFDSIQKFLQFQLTVNIAILTISLVLGFAGVEQPLQLLHLLWVNMIMDSLASVALASEPPTERQLRRPPVNRSLFIITTQMWFNMLGQAGFQVVIIIIMMFRREILPDCEETGPGTKHYTMVFNVFVLLQLFNEYNCRFLEGELNLFRGLIRNPTFLAVSGITFALQVLMAQFGGKILQLHPMGLDGSQWGICVALGFASWLWQPFVNLARMSCSCVCGCMHRQSQRAKLADHIGRGDYP